MQEEQKQEIAPNAAVPQTSEEVLSPYHVRPWLVCTAALVAVVGVCVFTWLGTQRPVSIETIPEGGNTEVSGSDMQQPVVAIEEGEVLPTLIYSEVVSEQVTENRNWPTIAIYKKRGDAPAVKLGVVGGVGEYPIATVLSPNRSLLAVNLESAIVVIDTNTGTHTRISLPEGGAYNAISFSPDSSRVAFAHRIVASDVVTSEHGSYSTEQSSLSSLYIVELASQKITELYRTQTDYTKGEGGNEFDQVIEWRAGDVLVLGFNHGKDGPIPHYLYSLSQKTLTPEEEYSALKAVKSIPLAKETVCEHAWDSLMISEGDYRMYGTSVWEYTDFASGAAHSFGMPEHGTIFLAYSKDEHAVLYKSVTLPLSSLDECYRFSAAPLHARIQDLPGDYIVHDFDDDSTTTISETEEVLRAWRADTALASMSIEGDPHTQSQTLVISVHGKPVVTAPYGKLELIAHYYGTR